jgi:hypothetical protein
MRTTRKAIPRLIEPTRSKWCGIAAPKSETWSTAGAWRIMLDAAGGTFEGGKARAANEAIGLLNGLIAIFGAYFVGHWIGARASRLGIVTMALIGSATAVIWIGSDVFYFSPGKRYTDRFGSEALTALAILGRFTGIVLPEASPIAA